MNFVHEPYFDDPSLKSPNVTPTPVVPARPDAQTPPVVISGSTGWSGGGSSWAYGSAHSELIRDIQSGHIIATVFPGAGKARRAELVQHVLDRLENLKLAAQDDGDPFDEIAAKTALAFVQEAVLFARPSVFLLDDGAIRLSWSAPENGQYFGLMFSSQRADLHFVALGKPAQEGGAPIRSAGYIPSGRAWMVANAFGLGELVARDQ